MAVATGVAAGGVGRARNGGAPVAPGELTYRLSSKSHLTRRGSWVLYR